MTSGRAEDGTPFVALGNSEPIPQWMLDRDDLGELLVVIREGRRRNGWCDHGKRLDDPHVSSIDGKVIPVCELCA